MEDLDVTILYDEGSNGRQVYQLINPINFIGWEHRVFIRKGFKSDLVSLPWILRILASTTGRWTKAGIFHDFLYRTHFLSRKECDAIFYKIMKDCRVPKWKRTIAYYLVRCFGGLPYKKMKKEINEQRKYGYVESVSKGYSV